MLLLLLFLLVGVPYGYSAPVLPTDNFRSLCTFLSDPPLSGFQLWDDPKTWGGNGPIPGINDGKDFNVTIPCGMAVLLNVNSIQLHTLRVQGFLKILDDSSLPNINIRANYILVEGQFTIGSGDEQFKNKVKIELTPNIIGNRANLLFTSNFPADVNYPRDLGHKAFAVVGGQVHFHGLPMPPSIPVWCKLAKTANVGDMKIFLDKVISWPIGSEIVVASTDYEKEQAEVFVIKSRVNSPKGTLIGLDKPLKHMHYGDPKGLDDGFGNYLDQCAEVALLSRNIIVTGTYESNYKLEGGHFIIFHTQIQQFIEGVDFRGMGQQGRLGRYPIHFHLNGDQFGSEGTVCRKNTIRDSNQRCIVVHATFGMKIEENVAYNTKGHCFLTEEGGETNNTFIRNIGIVINPVTQLIPKEKFKDALAETDDSPSVFWISNPSNNLVDNVAAGSADSGIWFELRDSVRGISRSWSKLNKMNPQTGLLGRVIGNTVHSNDVIGFRLYPHGFFPSIGENSVTAKIHNLNAYKNPWIGVFSHNNEDIVFINATLADNRVGMFMNSVQSNVLKDSRVVGFSKNYGNPEYCDEKGTWVRCRPTINCKLPVPNGEFGRNIGWPEQNYPLLGVQMNQLFGDEFYFSKGYPNSVESTKFSNFDDTCWPAAAIGLTAEEQLPVWNSANSVKGLSFTPETNRVWVTPQISKFNLDLQTIDGGEVAKYYSLQDSDGSLTGSKGYVVANNPKILPVNPKSCKFYSAWNAYSCPQTCYRSILVEYPEPSFFNNVKAKVGKFSSLVVTRVRDAMQFQVDGNFRQSKTPWWGNDKQRYFYFSVLAGEAYSLSVKTPVDNPNFFPSSMEISYRDGPGGGCGLGVTFRVPSPKNRQWKVSPSPSVFYSPCAGVSEQNLNPTTYKYICLSSVSVLEIYVWPSLETSVVLSSSSLPTSCVSTTECGILKMGSPGWRYDDSGKELRPDYINPLFNEEDWKIGAAPLGYREYNFPLNTNLSRPSESIVTYYYRKKFTLENTACYVALNIDVLMNDGVVLYLNNNELLRGNIPAGPVKNSTLALSYIDGDEEKAWKRFSVPLEKSQAFLVHKTNYLSVEVHQFKDWAWQTTFDIRISALQARSKCQGEKITLEVCDGVDNDNDGKIDEDLNGRPLTRPCSTACGKGIETCLEGSWRSCTAPPVQPERCDNVDDNCDGLIDNGLSRLDCPQGNVCYRGSCRNPFLPCSASNCLVAQKEEVVFFEYETSWRFLDSSLPLPSSDWMLPSFSDKSWPSGNGFFGFGNWDFTTKINIGKDKKSPRITQYFRKSFSVPDANCFFQLNHTLYATEGAVVYINGIEVYRQNMPMGPVSPMTLAKSWTDWNEIPKLITGSWLRKGVNFIAVETHTYGGDGEYSTDGVFDSRLTGFREGKSCKL